MLKFLCIILFRQQLQELRLKQELQEQRDQKGGRRRDLQGETAGERVKPRQASALSPNSNCDLRPVRLNRERCSVHMTPQEGVEQPLCCDELFIL